MYTGETPIILDKIKAENCWFEKQLGQWDEIVRWIKVTPQPSLRFLENILGDLILQQEYECVVYFKLPQIASGGDLYDTKYFSYWLNVPIEEWKY
jgi:hypothetical protein